MLDTLDYLHTGGRLDPALDRAASRLTARPLLHVVDGKIVVLEKVRTPSAAARRLEEVAVAFAGARPVDVAVQHLGHPERAAALAERLERLIPGARRSYLAEAGAVWRDVTAAAARHGLATLAGSSPSVGVTGYTLGGGDASFPFAFMNQPAFTTPSPTICT